MSLEIPLLAQKNCRVFSPLDRLIEGACLQQRGNIIFLFQNISKTLVGAYSLSAPS